MNTLTRRNTHSEEHTGSEEHPFRVTRVRRTGLALEDVDAVTVLLHRHGALAVWDYASAAPYVAIDMNPLLVPTMASSSAAALAAAGEGGSAAPSAAAAAAAAGLAHKDAVFFSTHKLLGGPGAPGVLVVKKRLLASAVPGAPGGGTVFYVTPADHRYLSNRAEREEGGTPDVLGAIRAGLAFKVGSDRFES